MQVVRAHECEEEDYEEPASYRPQRNLQQEETQPAAAAPSSNIFNQAQQEVNSRDPLAPAVHSYRP